MDGSSGFEERAEKVVSHRENSALAARLEDALSLTPGTGAEAFWIRDSEDLVNIAWVTPFGISDVTWFPARDSATFNFLRFSAVIGLEVREAPAAASTLGVPVSGSLVVIVRPTGDRGTLLWVAEDEPGNTKDLRVFATYVLRRALGS